MTPEQARRIWEENVRRRQRLVIASYMMQSGGGSSGTSTFAYSSHALALDFKNGSYWSGGTQYTPLSAMPGYTYTRTGAKGEKNAATSGDVIDDFAANVPGIPSGVGYWSRGALTNLITRSQEFDNGAWFKGGVTVTANTTVAPDGTTTADTMTRSAVVESHYVQDPGAAVVAGTVYTRSVYAKMGSGRYLQMVFAASGGVFAAANLANFDLQLGVLGTVAGGVTAYIESAGGGWYRCTTVATCAVSGNAGSYIAPVDSASAAQLATGAGDSSTVMLWQHQFLAGNLPDGGPIIVTGAAAVAVGADAMAVSATLGDTDHIVWATAKLDVAVNNQYVTLTGAAGHRINLSSHVSAGFGYRAFIEAGGVNVFSADIGPNFIPGTGTILLRRRAGKYTLFAKRGDGVIVSSAESAAVAAPVITTLQPGQQAAFAVYLEGVATGAFIRQGTFDDAAINAILAAA